GAIRYATAAALKSGGAGLAVNTPSARPAPVRFSFGAGIPPPRLDARAATRPVLRVIVPSSQKAFPLFAGILTSAGRSSSPLALRHLSWPAAACGACSFFSALHDLSDARVASGCFVQLATFLSSFMNNPG